MLQETEKRCEAQVEQVREMINEDRKTPILLKSLKLLAVPKMMAAVHLTTALCKLKSAPLNV